MPAFAPKRALALLAALGLPFVASCAGDHVVNPPAPPVELTLQVGEHRVLTEQQVDVGFERVAADSRCPIHVVCIWEGEARVDLALRSIRGRKLARITLLASPPSSVETDRYRVSALALDPYPGDPGPIPQSAYRLRLRIESAR